MTIISSLIIRSSKRRLHTLVVTTQIIKPFVPTPSQLKTYNLSVIDQFVPSVFIPLIAFYPKTTLNHHQILVHLKNSLSRTLTKYYPFAGRYAKVAPTYVDCKDQGAEFVEATVDCTITDFLKRSQHEDLDQLFPYGRIWRYLNPEIQTEDTVVPLVVQANRFECGGLAVAVSLSHKVADGYSLIHFVNDWAKQTRACSIKEERDQVMFNDPHFMSFENTNLNPTEYALDVTKDCVTRSFIFPNAKLKELKLEVETMSQGRIVNPTRVEVLTWLLYNCAVSATASFTTSSIGLSANLRDKISIEPLPEKCIGNFLVGLEVKTTKEAEVKPEFIIGELRKQKMGIQRLNNLGAFFNLFQNISPHSETNRTGNNYICTSFGGFPLNGIDFGWGSPMKVTLARNLKKNSFVLMDAPKDEDGIEALVCLEKQDMDIIQQDPQLLAFC